MIRAEKPTRLERVALALLNNCYGISERELVQKENMTSGRNEIAEIERLINVKFNRTWEKTVDGLGQYYRYSCPDRTTAETLIKFANAKARARGAMALSKQDTETILHQFSN